MPWQLSGQAAGPRLRSVRPARPTPPKELLGVPPRAGESVPVGTKTCRLIFLFTNWRALTHYLDDGNVPIDNNAVENSIRPLAVGRNNANCSFMRTRRRRRMILPSVKGHECVSATSHNHSDCRNCINPFGGR